MGSLHEGKWICVHNGVMMDECCSCRAVRLEVELAAKQRECDDIRVSAHAQNKLMDTLRAELSAERCDCATFCGENERLKKDAEKRDAELAALRAKCGDWRKRLDEDVSEGSEYADYAQVLDELESEAEAAKGEEK